MVLYFRTKGFDISDGLSLYFKNGDVFVLNHWFDNG